MRRTCLPDVVDGQNIRVIQSRGGSGFLPEAPHALSVVGKGNGQKLQGDLTSESRVLSQINISHPSRTDLRKNSVWPHRVPRRQFRVSIVNQWCSDLSCGRLKKASGLFIRNQQRLYLPSQQLIAGTRFIKERDPLF